MLFILSGFFIIWGGLHSPNPLGRPSVPGRGPQCLPFSDPMATEATPTQWVNRVKGKPGSEWNYDGLPAGASVTTKAQPFRVSATAGGIVFKRIKCTGGKCDVFKIGYCIDCRSTHFRFPVRVGYRDKMIKNKETGVSTVVGRVPYQLQGATTDILQRFVRECVGQAFEDQQFGGFTMKKTGDKVKAAFQCRDKATRDKVNTHIMSF